jgi:hypothetical protein
MGAQPIMEILKKISGTNRVRESHSDLQQLKSGIRR